MNELKDLYKIIEVPASITVTGKGFFAIVRQSYHTDPRVIPVKQNLLKNEAEAALKQYQS